MLAHHSIPKLSHLILPYHLAALLSYVAMAMMVWWLAIAPGAWNGMSKVRSRLAPPPSPLCPPPRCHVCPSAPLYPLPPPPAPLCPCLPPPSPLPPRHSSPSSSPQVFRAITLVSTVTALFTKYTNPGAISFGLVLLDALMYTAAYSSSQSGDWNQCALRLSLSRSHPLTLLVHPSPARPSITTPRTPPRPPSPAGTTPSSSASSCTCCSSTPAIGSPPPPPGSSTDRPQTPRCTPTTWPRSSCGIPPPPATRPRGSSRSRPVRMQR